MNVRRIAGYWPYVLMLFINAFVDLGHKIVIQNTIFKIYDGDLQVALTAIVNALILLPFIMLFSPSGYIADRFAKPAVMRCAAWLAVGLCAAITLCYALGWFWPAFAMTFLLATQSAIYSPAKFGYIKELLGVEGLARGNAVVQAMTTIAILSGMLVYSAAFEARLVGLEASSASAILQQMWPLGLVLTLLSLIEALAAYRLPTPVGGDKQLRFDWASYRSGRMLRANYGQLRKQPAIWWTILGLSGFWAISQVLIATFPEFAESQLGVHSTTVVQGLLGASIIGIMAGSLLAGHLSRHHIETAIIPLGALGLTLGLLLTPLLESVWAQGLNFVLFGLCGGLFIVPLNALMQYHAPAHEAGRILAGNNFIQNIIMVAFLAATVALSKLGLNSGQIIWVLAGVALLGTLGCIRVYPQSLLRLLVVFTVRRFYRLHTTGFEQIPTSGGALLLGNHISWVDWALLQAASPRPIRFVLERGIYQQPLLHWFFRLFGCIPISADRSREALRIMGDALAAGELVCLFPEGTISRTGHLAEFKKGYEVALRRAGDACVIVPFYLHGMWGSRLSRACSPALTRPRGRRDLMVAFGAPLPFDTPVAAVKQQVRELAVRCVALLPESVPSLLTQVRRRRRSGQHLLLPYGGKPRGRRRLWRDAVTFAAALRQLPAGGVVLASHSGHESTTVLLGCWLAGRSLCLLPDGATNLPLAEQGLRWWFGAAEHCPAGLELLALPKVNSAALWLSRVRAAWASENASAVALWQVADEQLLPLTFGELIHQSRQIADLLQLKAGSRLLVAAPFGSPLALRMGLLLPLLEPVCAVQLAGTGDSLLLGRAIARQQVDCLLLGAAEAESLLADERVSALHLASLSRVICTKEVSFEQRQLWWQRFGQRLHSGLLDPASGWLTLNVDDLLDVHYWFVQQGDKPGSRGQPLPGVALCEQQGQLAVAVADECGLLHWRPLTLNGKALSGRLDSDGYLWMSDAALAQEKSVQDDQ